MKLRFKILFSIVLIVLVQLVILSNFWAKLSKQESGHDTGTLMQNPSSNKSNETLGETIDEVIDKTAILYLMKPKGKEIFKSFESLCEFYRPYSHTIMLGHFTEETRSKKFGSFLIKIGAWFSERQNRCPFKHRTFSVTERFKQEDKYRRMCTYFASGFLMDPALQQFTYIVRFDSDSELIAAPYPSIITQTQNYLYSYHCWCYDIPKWTRNLPEFVEEYVKSHKITPSYPTFEFPTNGSFIPMPYTNFFVVNRRKLAENKALVKFLDASSNGTKEYRWGDAPIWGMAIGLFLNEDELHYIPLDYSHDDVKTFTTANFHSEWKWWSHEGHCGWRTFTRW